MLQSNIYTNKVHVYKIAVFRALQLGDMLCAIPAFRALRKAYPHAEITLIGLPWAKEFTKRFNSYIDNFIAFPGYPGLPEQQADEKKFKGFLNYMRQKRFDLIIQMQGDGKITNSLLSHFHAKIMAGSYRNKANCPDTATFTKYRDDRAEVLRTIHALEKLGVIPQGEELEFPITEKDKKELQKSPEFLQIKHPYVCIHPGARDPNGRWNAKYFAYIADTLKSLGYDVAITGVERENFLVTDVIRQMRFNAINFSGKLSLGGTAALLSNSQLVISNSTGIAHLADALHIPSIVIFLKPDHNRWAPLDRELHKVVFGKQKQSQLQVLKEAITFLEKKELLKIKNQGLSYFIS